MHKIQNMRQNHEINTLYKSNSQKQFSNEPLRSDYDKDKNQKEKESNLAKKTINGIRRQEQSNGLNSKPSNKKIPEYTNSGYQGPSKLATNREGGSSQGKQLIKSNSTQNVLSRTPKQSQINSLEYKKLHEKLNSIENKLSDIKKNLQKKKEEKMKQKESGETQGTYQRQRSSKKELQLSSKEQVTNKQPQESKKNSLASFVTKVEEPKQRHNTFTMNPYSPKHNVYYVSEIVRAYKDERSLARQHVNTSLHILKLLQNSKMPSNEQVEKRKVNLVKKNKKKSDKVIIFDLDETLIHCNDNVNQSHDVKLPIKFPTGEIIEAGINVRPYAKEILKNLAQKYEVIVFTASHSCYANVVIDHLDPNREYVDHRLFREHCHNTPEGMYIKDLRIINREMHNMVLVDNAAYSYAYQLDNGIPIIPYYQGSVDFQLKALQTYINQMVFVKDVRMTNRKTFQLTKYRNYYNEPERLVEELYLN